LSGIRYSDVGSTSTFPRKSCSAIIINKINIIHVQLLDFGIDIIEFRILVAHFDLTWILIKSCLVPKCFISIQRLLFQNHFLLYKFESGVAALVARATDVAEVRTSASVSAERRLLENNLLTRLESLHGRDWCRWPSSIQTFGSGSSSVGGCTSGTLLTFSFDRRIVDCTGVLVGYSSFGKWVDGHE
jgi:hypothetical protein